MKRTAFTLAIAQLLIVGSLFAQGGSGDGRAVPILYLGANSPLEDSDEENDSSNSTSIDIEKKKKEEKTPNSQQRIIPRLKLSPEKNKSPEKGKQKSKKRSKNFSGRLSDSARNLLSPKSPIKKEKALARETSHIPNTEEALERLHEIIHINDGQIALRPSTLIERILRLEHNSYENNGRSEFLETLEEINRLISPTIPSQRDRIALNLLYSLIQDYVIESLKNDLIQQGLHAALLFKAFKHNEGDEIQNTFAWHKIVKKRIGSIMHCKKSADPLKALRLVSLHYIINALHEWSNQDIEDELLIIANTFYIQIPTHAEIGITNALSQIERAQAELEKATTQANEARSLIEKLNNEGGDKEMQEALNLYQRHRGECIRSEKILAQAQDALIQSQKKLLLAYIISSEIYLILGEINLPSFSSNTRDALEQAHDTYLEYFGK